MTPTPANDTKPIAKPMSQVSVYADRAVAMMRSLGVVPNPKNYSIFFACAAGQPTDLVKEVERAVNTKNPFTDEFLDGLYLKYVAESNARAVQDTAFNAKKILADMIHNVTQFAGDTSAVTQDVLKQIEQLDAEASEDMVRLVAANLVQSAMSMQNSSETITVRLAGAQQEIIELRETLARVVTEAERDFLTGSYNRKAFDRHLTEAVSETKTQDTDLALLMIDIDHFKKFNDTFGHLIGDEVLKTVAKTLADTLKGTDLVARYGGEEFAVLLPRTPAGGGVIVADEIRKSIARRELTRKSTGESFGIITVSIGVAALRADDTPESFIQRADKALYVSKNNGRNRVTREGHTE